MPFFCWLFVVITYVGALFFLSLFGNGLMVDGRLFVGSPTPHIYSFCGASWSELQTPKPVAVHLFIFRDFFLVSYKFGFVVMLSSHVVNG
jgi:hypothetical protein